MGLFGIGKNKVKEPEPRQGNQSDNTSVIITDAGLKKVDTLKSPFFEVLNAVNDAGGNCTISEIAETTGYSTSKAKTIANNLAKSGYVKGLKME